MVKGENLAHELLYLQTFASVEITKGKHWKHVQKKMLQIAQMSKA